MIPETRPPARRRGRLLTAGVALCAVLVTVAAAVVLTPTSAAAPAERDARGGPHFDRPLSVQIWNDHAWAHGNHRCLLATDGGTLAQHLCGPDASSNWVQTDTRHDHAGRDGWSTTLRSNATGECLAAGPEGAAVTQPCADTPAQRWTLTDVPGDAMQYRWHPTTDLTRCLTAANERAPFVTRVQPCADPSDADGLSRQTYRTWLSPTLSAALTAAPDGSLVQRVDVQGAGSGAPDRRALVTVLVGPVAPPASGRCEDISWGYLGVDFTGVPPRATVIGRGHRPQTAVFSELHDGSSTSVVAATPGCYTLAVESSAAGTYRRASLIDAGAITAQVPAPDGGS